ncbi:hypothetical protein T484DRAFT_1797697 [Baffinella frigidus]|nr:hypothetical protein T484DRAFT_1797697 [Cryptophyta sp. CCMP2293]
MRRTRLLLGVLVVVGASADPSGRQDERVGARGRWERRVEQSPGLGSSEWEKSYGPRPPPQELPADWRRVARGRSHSRPASASLASLASAEGRSAAEGAGLGSDEWEQKFGPVRRVQGALHAERSSNVGRQSSLQREDGSWNAGSGMHVRRGGGEAEAPRAGRMQSGRPRRAANHKLVALRVDDRMVGQPLAAPAAAAEAARGRGANWIVPALTRVIEDDGGVAPKTVAKPRARTHQKRVQFSAPQLPATRNHWMATDKDKAPI